MNGYNAPTSPETDGLPSGPEPSMSEQIAEAFDDAFNKTQTLITAVNRSLENPNDTEALDSLAGLEKDALECLRRFGNLNRDIIFKDLLSFYRETLNGTADAFIETVVEPVIQALQRQIDNALA